ncbi:DUF4825 domain-containing protein [Guptibacillus hwajinpoensis]|uniref:DUF4825 domain-containing protein n=1 Tax=Guptibacillus hwajinpoensis TaxID=208199 RepID=UPI001CFF0A06|nr:DUF4825 domain-containing protein [Pseudalkalibacillus hwajinpoensis]
MKKSKWLAFVFLLLLATGCSSGKASDQAIKTVGDVQSSSLLNDSGTYVGNNSDVLALLSHLPGGETVKKLNLSDERIAVTYEAKGTISDEEFQNYWFSGDQNRNKTLLYNAIHLSLLVPNARGYEFYVQGKSMSMTRDEMRKILSDEFADLPSEDELMNEETASEFLTTHEGKLEKMANDYEDYFDEK